AAIGGNSEWPRRSAVGAGEFERRTDFQSVSSSSCKRSDGLEIRPTKDTSVLGVLPMKRLLLLALLAAALAGCSRNSDKPDLPRSERPSKADDAPDADVRAVAAANNAFALDLYRQMNDDNLFFSPLSVSTALSMTYAGARGDTAAEMSKALHYPFEGERLHHG